MKRSFFVPNLLEIDTIDVAVLSQYKHNTIIQLLIIFVIIAGIAILILIIIGLIFVYINCIS